MSARTFEENLSAAIKKILRDYPDHPELHKLRMRSWNAGYEAGKKSGDWVAGYETGMAVRNYALMDGMGKRHYLTAEEAYDICEEMDFEGLRECGSISPIKGYQRD
jgi:hypothetical protein